MKINNRFEMERDANQWILTEHSYGERIDKDTGETVQTHTTRQRYYSSLINVCTAVIDFTAGEATDMESIKECIQRSKNELFNVIHSGAWRVS